MSAFKEWEQKYGGDIADDLLESQLASLFYSDMCSAEICKELGNVPVRDCTEVMLRTVWDAYENEIDIGKVLVKYANLVYGVKIKARPIAAKIVFDELLDYKLGKQSYDDFCINTRTPVLEDKIKDGEVKCIMRALDDPTNYDYE